jgi:hypothetical protein
LLRFTGSFGLNRVLFLNCFPFCPYLDPLL